MNPSRSQRKKKRERSLSAKKRKWRAKLAAETVEMLSPHRYDPGQLNLSISGVPVPFAAADFARVTAKEIVAAINKHTDGVVAQAIEHDGKSVVQVSTQYRAVGSISIGSFVFEPPHFEAAELDEHESESAQGTGKEAPGGTS